MLPNLGFQAPDRSLESLLGGDPHERRVSEGTQVSLARERTVRSGGQDGTGFQWRSQPLLPRLSPGMSEKLSLLTQ